MADVFTKHFDDYSNTEVTDKASEQSAHDNSKRKSKVKRKSKRLEKFIKRRMNAISDLLAKTINPLEEKQHQLEERIQQLDAEKQQLEERIRKLEDDKKQLESRNKKLQKKLKENERLSVVRSVPSKAKTFWGKVADAFTKALPWIFRTFATAIAGAVFGFKCKGTKNQKGVLT